MSFMKNKAIEMDLPFLTRKWDKIDETRQSRKDASEARVSEVWSKKQSGMEIKEIAISMGLKPGGVYSCLRRYKKQHPGG
jgi:hypothetical protein